MDRSLKSVSCVYSNLYVADRARMGSRGQGIEGLPTNAKLDDSNEEERYDGRGAEQIEGIKSFSFLFQNHLSVSQLVILRFALNLLLVLFLSFCPAVRYVADFQQPHLAELSRTIRIS